MSGPLSRDRGPDIPLLRWNLGHEWETELQDSAPVPACGT